MLAVTKGLYLLIMFSIAYKGKEVLFTSWSIIRYLSTPECHLKANKILDVVKESSKLNLYSSYFTGFGSTNTGSLFGQAASTGGTVFGQVNNVCLPPFASTCSRPIPVVPTRCKQLVLCARCQQTASRGSQLSLLQLPRAGRDLRLWFLRIATVLTLLWQSSRKALKKHTAWSPSIFC